MAERYDRQMILDFLTQLVGELKIQQMELEGKLLPPKVKQVVDQYRRKWGAQVVPDYDDFQFVLADVKGTGDKNRQELAALRSQQFDRAFGFVQLLQELGIVQAKEQAT
jgi:hypothetical protein